MTTNTHIAAQARDLASKAARLGARRFGDELIQCLRECAQALEAAPALDAQGERTPRFWKVGDELLPFHKSASHVSPDYRDGWNACWYALKNDTIAAPPPPAVGKPLSEQQIAVLRFLDGVGDLRGHGFGMKPPEERGNYWWRKYLRAAFPDVDFGIVTKETGNG